MYLTPDELVARYRGIITKRTLANWRSNGNSGGPPYTKIGGKILYPSDQLTEWEIKRSFGLEKIIRIMMALAFNGEFVTTLLDYCSW